MIVQDTGFGEAARPGLQWASAAVELFMNMNSRFEIDRSRERFVMTNNPQGFLKRIR